MMTEEEQLREDKKKPYEEDPNPELIPVQTDPSRVDGERNQAGPSTLRPSAQKIPMSSDGSESGGKKMKPTVVKPTHELVSESPASKRLKPEEPVERRLEMTQVGEEYFPNLDRNIGQEELWAYENEIEENEEETKHDIPEALWSEAPLDRVPPDPPKWIDDLADAVEEWRLWRLGVIAPLEELKEGYKLLTTRFVRDWRVKPNPAKEGAPKMFLWRSRMVAREYANTKRDDVHSPATGGQTLRLIPAVYLMRRLEEEAGGPKFVLGVLDVKDAFLQVPQEEQTQVTTAGGHFEVLRNLPGRRIGAKAWFDHLTSCLRERGFTFSDINPCLGRLEHKAVLLIHVDDLLFAGEQQYIDEDLPAMRKSFEISSQYLTTPGSSFQFLRRTYEMTPNGLKILPGKYAESMIEAYEEVMDKAKVQKLPRTQEMLEPDGTSYLSPELASLYRSIVGCGMYLSQERPDVAFTMKELASSMANPTTGSVRKLSRLIGYLKGTLGQHTMVELPEPGWGLVSKSTQTRWLLETCS